MQTILSLVDKNTSILAVLIIDKRSLIPVTKIYPILFKKIVLIAYFFFIRIRII